LECLGTTSRHIPLVVGLQPTASC